MKNSYVILIGCTIISIGLIIQGYLLRDTVEDNEVMEKETFINDTRVNLNLEEASIYLNLTEKELEKIIEHDRYASPGIPYFKVGDNYYFYIESLNDWLKLMTEVNYEWDF